MNSNDFKLILTNPVNRVHISIDQILRVDRSISVCPTKSGRLKSAVGGPGIVLPPFKPFYPYGGPAAAGARSCILTPAWREVLLFATLQAINFKHQILRVDRS
jgi:hypothetical protein